MFKKLNYILTMIITASVISLATIFNALGFGLAGFNPKKEPSLEGASGWINTPPLKLTNLRGKVVLIDFWTYTCINWRRTLPYVRAWSSKYKEQGLVVIGVHTPEFKFEYQLENVQRSIQEMNIGYPVALDNNYAVWNSFKNQYWPALYLVDAKGKLRYQKFGEGDYRESELQIQQLLKEASAKDISDEPVALRPEGFEVAADWESLASPENFLGYDRNEGFASPGGIVPDKAAVYTVPAKLTLNRWALSGEWVVGKENVRSLKTQCKIIYHFHARDLHLIMGPSKKGASIKFRILINGSAPGAAHGLDVDSNGEGTVTVQRVYQLIRQQGAITDQVFQIEFLDPEMEVFDFTFG